MVSFVHSFIVPLTFLSPPSLLSSIIIREAQEQLELAKHRAERPKIQQQFADLKRGLSAVTDDEWENIPEVGNLTRKKRRREERTYVVPDSVLVGDRAKNEFESSLDARQQEVCDSILFYFACINGLLLRMVDSRLQPARERSRILSRSDKLVTKSSLSNSIKYVPSPHPVHLIVNQISP